ncbi:hypothetical protein CBR_g17122 [Chara braunii]|uniref:Uncharacterized protein n=1 Tax=Chara braunii TaxID=69332 RepID=A0A388KV12_CHABU|nr:hypothetical protein CBR_g17122 [Chara braunii]|eukprot:GBG73783.1 hypothetical protein CBR_g17122 [Chara braunii]
MVETRSGKSTSPYTQENQEKIATLVRENKERKELLKQAKLKAIAEEQAKLKAIAEEQATKMKKLEEEMEEKNKVVEEEAAAEAEEERKRKEVKEESSGTANEDAAMEKKINEWIANLSLGEDKEAQFYVPQDERDAQEVHAQADISAKMDKMQGYFEVLSKAWMEERQANWGHNVALSAMRSGFRDFARDMVTHVGGEVRRLRDNVGKFCKGAIEGANAVAAIESEARPHKEPIKLKFPDAYGGKKKKNFDNWEVIVNSYVYLQHILIEEQVLVTFQTLKDEAASFARSLARAPGCENNLVAYYKITPLPQCFKLPRERFGDPTADITYDVLSREVVLFESKSMPVSTFWHWDLDKGKKWKGRTISEQVRAKDHMILTLEEGGTDEVPYSEIEWGLEEEDNSVGQWRSYAAVAAGGRPQGRGGGQGQRGQAT